MLSERVVAGCRHASWPLCHAGHTLSCYLVADGVQRDPHSPCELCLALQPMSSDTSAAVGNGVLGQNSLPPFSEAYASAAGRKGSLASRVLVLAPAAAVVKDPLEMYST